MFNLLRSEVCGSNNRELCDRIYSFEYYEGGNGELTQTASYDSGPIEHYDDVNVDYVDYSDKVSVETLYEVVNDEIPGDEQVDTFKSQLVNYGEVQSINPGLINYVEIIPGKLNGTSDYSEALENTSYRGRRGVGGTFNFGGRSTYYGDKLEKLSSEIYDSQVDTFYPDMQSKTSRRIDRLRTLVDDLSKLSFQRSDRKSSTYNSRFVKKLASILGIPEAGSSSKKILLAKIKTLIEKHVPIQNP